MSLTDIYLKLWSMLDLTGRLSRLQWLGRILAGWFATMVLIFILLACAAMLSGFLDGAISAVLVILCIFTMIFALFLDLSFNARRANDIGIEKWLVFLAYLPFIGLLFRLYLGLMPGKTNH